MTRNPFYFQLSATAAATGISALATVIQNILIARHLGLADYGAFAFAQSAILLIWALCNINSFQPLITHAARLREQNTPLSTPQLVGFCLRVDAALAIVATALSLALTLAASSLALRPTSMSADMLTQLCLLYSPMAGLLVLQNTPTGLFRHEQRFTLLAGIKIAFALLTTLLVAGAVWEKMGIVACLTAILIGRGAEFALLCGLAWYHTRGHAPKNAAAVFDALPTFKQALRGSYVQNLIMNMVENGDVFLVGWLFGDAEAGRMKIIRTMMNALLIGAIPLRVLCLPLISRMIASREHAPLRRFIRRFILACLGLSLPALIFAWFGQGPLLQFFIADGSLPPPPLLVMVFLTGILFNYLTVPIIPVLVANHWDRAFLRLLVADSALLLLCIFLLAAPLAMFSLALGYAMFHMLVFAGGLFLCISKGWIDDAPYR